MSDKHQHREQEHVPATRRRKPIPLRMASGPQDYVPGQQEEPAVLTSLADMLHNHGCPCGYYGDPVKECSCSASSIARYQKRISGPLLDRIDIHVEVPRVDYEKLADKRNASETIRKRVQAA